MANAIAAIVGVVTPIVLGVQPAAAQARYDVSVQIRPATRGIVVTGSVVLPAMPQPRDSIALLLWSRLKDVRFRAERERRLVQSTDSAAGDRTWVVRADPAFPAGQPVELHFSYRGDSLAAPQLRVDTLGAVVGGGGEIWYPRLAFDSLSVGTISVSVPSGHTALATGTLVSTAAERARGVFRFRANAAAHLAFASGRYRVSRTESGRVPVSLYVRPARENGDSLAERVSRVLDALIAIFGPLPYDEYAVAEVDFGGSVSGTSEFGFFLASGQEFDRGLPLTLIGHEIGHVWWGNAVRTKPGPGRMMLTEGIASYGMARAIAALEGDEALERLRTSRYPGAELRAGAEGYFRLAAAGLELPLTGMVPRGQFELLRMHRMANTRGWFVYDMFARRFGEDAFARFLAGILKEFRGGAISWSEFSTRAIGTFGPSARVFFEQWTERAGAPELAIRWTQSGNEVSGSVEQSPTTLVTSTVPVVLIGEGGSRRLTVTVSRASTPFRASVPFRVTSVVLDPDYTLLRWTPAIRRRAEALATATQVEWYRLYGSRDSAVAIYSRSRERLATIQPDTLGVAFQLHYQGSLALLAKGDTTAALEAMHDAIRQPVRDPTRLPSVYLTVARVHAQQGAFGDARSSAANAITADSLADSDGGVSADARALLDSLRSDRKPQ
jgi:hypothetical protein